MLRYVAVAALACLLSFSLARTDWVRSLESIYYLTGAGFEPLERPFFLLIEPSGGRGPVLLVPKLDGEHMGKARDVVGDIQTYWEYPAPEGRRWIARRTHGSGYPPESLDLMAAGNPRDATGQQWPAQTAMANSGNSCYPHAPGRAKRVRKHDPPAGTAGPDRSGICAPISL